MLKNHTGNSLSTDLGMEDAGGFKNFTTISPCDFKIVINMTGPSVTLQDTNFSITFAEKLAIILRFLATGGSFQSLMYLFEISKQSIVPEVCEAIINGLK